MLRNLFVSIILSLGLIGCTPEYMVHPDKPSFSEIAKDPAAAQAYIDEVNAGITALARTTLDAKKAGYLSPDSAASIYAQLVEAAHYMDEAEGFVNLNELSKASDSISKAEALINVVREVVAKFGGNE